MRTYKHNKYAQLGNTLAFANVYLVAIIVGFVGSFGYLLISNVMNIVGLFS
jgi:hypothetical protein